jgi:hypothetical protein
MPYGPLNRLTGGSPLALLLQSVSPAAVRQGRTPTLPS